jgi:hypothetical protein
MVEKERQWPFRAVERPILGSQLERYADVSVMLEVWKVKLMVSVIYS